MNSILPQTTIQLDQVLTSVSDSVRKLNATDVSELAHRAGEMFTTTMGTELMAAKIVAATCHYEMERRNQVVSKEGKLAIRVH